MVDELRAALSGLYADASRGGGLNGIEAALRPWFATYPQPVRDTAEWAAFWQAYVIACGHHSEASLHAGMKAWAKLPDSEFLPKPGRLSELARTSPTAAFKLASHAHELLQLADDMTGRQRVLDNMDRDQVKPEEQRQRVAELLEGFKAANEPVRERENRILRRGVNHAEKPEDLPPITGAQATGSALTPEMLRVLGRPIPAPRDPREPVQFTDGM